MSIIHSSLLLSEVLRSEVVYFWPFQWLHMAIKEDLLGAREDEHES